MFASGCQSYGPLKITVLVTFFCVTNTQGKQIKGRRFILAYGFSPRAAGCLVSQLW
jgi:hypothetical protein